MLSRSSFTLGSKLAGDLMVQLATPYSIHLNHTWNANNVVYGRANQVSGYGIFRAEYADIHKRVRCPGVHGWTKIASRD